MIASFQIRPSLYIIYDLQNICHEKRIFIAHCFGIFKMIEKLINHIKLEEEIMQNLKKIKKIFPRAINSYRSVVEKDFFVFDNENIGHKNFG
jgi:hypothetical protein